MTNTTDVFGSDAAPAPGQGADNHPTEVKPEDLLAQITAPDGRQKYNDVPSALKALLHAQGHIPKVEEENERLRQELAGMKKLEDMLAKFTPAPQPQGGNPSPQAGTGLTEEQVRKLAAETLASLETKRQAEQNVQAAQNALIEKFGDAGKVKEALAAKATEIGVDVSFFKNLAVTSPKAVLAYFPVETKPSGSIKPTVNTAALGGDAKKPQVKNVMFGANTRDIVDAWNAAAPQP